MEPQPHIAVGSINSMLNHLETENVTDKKDNPFEEPIEFDVETNEGTKEESEIVEELDSELAQAEEEIAKHREAMLRMQAEMENLRKRLNRDLERSRKLALERIMKDLLQVWDSLERGLEVDAQSLSVESLVEGQGLTLKMLEKVMQDHDLQIIDPDGQPFDPELHEAMTVLPSEDVEENTVIEVLQKGFILHDRLIRPAMVVVSGKP
jgi:molecular chaperone GrpE